MSMLSLAPATTTAGSLGSMATAGSFCLFCENGLGGLPMLTRVSCAAAGPASAATRTVAANVHSAGRNSRRSTTGTPSDEALAERPVRPSRLAHLRSTTRPRAEGWDPRLRLLRGLPLLLGLPGGQRRALPGSIRCCRGKGLGGTGSLGRVGSRRRLGWRAVDGLGLRRLGRGDLSVGLDLTSRAGFGSPAVDLPRALPCAGVPGAFSWPGAAALPGGHGADVPARAVDVRPARACASAFVAACSRRCGRIAAAHGSGRRRRGARHRGRLRGADERRHTRPGRGDGRAALSAGADGRGGRATPTPPTSAATRRTLAAMPLAPRPARPPAALVAPPAPTAAPRPEPPAAEPSTAALRPAAGTTGSAIASAARWQRTAAS